MNLLGALFTALPFVVALLLGLLLPLLGLLLYRHFKAGLWFLVLVFLGDALFIGRLRINLGINLYANDFFFLLLGTVAAARWLWAADMPRRHGSWLAFVAIFVFSLISGLVAHGTAAGVQARDGFYSVVAASYFMSYAVDERRIAQLFDALVVVAGVLLLLCAYRWSTTYLPLPELLPPGGRWSADNPMRVIPSHEALLLAQVLVLGLFFSPSSRGTRWARLLLPLLLAVVVLLQHRSVWLAGLIGIVVALVLGRPMQRSRGVQLAALVIVASLSALPLMLSDRLAGVTQEVGRSAATALAGSGTVHSRLQDWRQTVGEWAASGPRALAVGWAFGRDPRRTLLTEAGERQTIRFGSHNHYVSLLTQTGVLGLAAFVLLAFGALIGVYRLAAQRADSGQSAALLALLAMQLAYYVPYGTDYLQHSLLGIVVAWVATRRAPQATAWLQPARAAWR